MGDFIYKHINSIKLILFGALLFYAAYYLQNEGSITLSPEPEPEVVAIKEAYCNPLSSPESSILVVVYSDGSVRTVEVPVTVCKALFD